MPRKPDPLSKRSATRTFTGAEVQARVMSLKASKRARRIREDTEFDSRALRATIRAPSTSSSAYSWDLEAIRLARDDQMRGRFATPVRLAESMRTDDALAVAFDNRLAPIRMISVGIEPGRGARAEQIAVEAEGLFGQDGVAIQQDTVQTLAGDLANHGLAIGIVSWTPRVDGSRIDCEVHAWPLEHVWWDESKASLMTRTADGIVPITHGDGRWIVIRKTERTPWRHDAALLPGALVWARHAFAARDWGKGSASHGNAKVVGTMPQGFDLTDGEGNPTPEASAFMTMLQDVASLDNPVAIKPFGAELDYLVNSSGAWEVWERAMLSAERAAARIYLGTDGTLGATGGAPGVDIAQLFGVARTRVEGDLGAIAKGMQTGVVEIWCAVNFGDSMLCPRRFYQIPDVDLGAITDAYAKRALGMHAELKAARENSVVVDQAYCDRLAERYQVDPVIIPDTPEVTRALQLAPTDVAKVVRVNEARSAQGLPHIEGPDGQLFLPEVGVPPNSTS